VIADLDANGIGYVVGPTFWPEGDSIILSGGGGDGSLWEATVTTGELREVFAADDPHLPGAVAVDISADGEWISVYSARNIAVANVEGYFGFVHRPSGNPLIVVSAEGAGGGFLLPAGFSPDGRAAASVLKSDPLMSGVWQLDSGPPVQLLTLQSREIDPKMIDVSLGWSNTGTILVPLRGNAAEVLNVSLDP
jgi:hypothetical protein